MPVEKASLRVYPLQDAQGSIQHSVESQLLYEMQVYACLLDMKSHPVCHDLCPYGMLRQGWLTSPGLPWALCHGQQQPPRQAIQTSSMHYRCSQGSLADDFLLASLSMKGICKCVGLFILPTIPVHAACSVQQVSPVTHCD